MELERKRGISISSTVLQFDYSGYRINLLDTPGHKDFSEDTYRVLTAVDAVVMVIDAGKGIEAQTRKLFDVCRMRQMPIFTFMNKCDRPTLEPLALLDELERVLKIGTFPVNWPIGNGPDFKGVYDRHEHQVHLFERTVGGAYARRYPSAACPTRRFAGGWMTRHMTKVAEELGMLEHAGETFDAEAVLAGKNHSGVLRQRDEQLRRQVDAGRVSETFLRTQAAYQHGPHHRAGRTCLFRIYI